MRRWHHRRHPGADDAGDEVRRSRCVGPASERPGAPGEFDALGQDITVRRPLVFDWPIWPVKHSGYPLNRRADPQISHQQPCGFQVNFSGVAALI